MNAEPGVTSVYLRIIFGAYGFVVGLTNVVLGIVLFALQVDIGVLFWAIFFLILSTGYGTAAAEIKGWHRIRYLSFVAFLPIVFAAGFIAAILVAVFWGIPVIIFFVIRGNLDARRFRRQLAAHGRFLTYAELRPKLELGEGTLIAEAAFKGIYQIWWTEDDLCGKANSVENVEEWLSILRGQENPSNRLILKEYLDQDSGKAVLTTISSRLCE